MAGATIGTGATFTFSTATAPSEITSISSSGREGKAINSSHLGTDNAETFIAGALYNNGTIDLEYHWDGEQAVGTILNSVDTFTLTWATNVSYSGPCIILSNEINVPTEDKQTATMSIQISDELDTEDIVAAS